MNILIFALEVAPQERPAAETQKMSGNKSPAARPLKQTIIERPKDNDELF